MTIYTCILQKSDKGVVSQGPASSFFKVLWAEDVYIGLFQKKITFLVRKLQKFCVWLLTLYAFIICQVIIRTQYYTNASLISAPVIILYQNVRGA